MKEDQNRNLEFVKEVLGVRMVEEYVEWKKWLEIYLRKTFSRIKYFVLITEERSC